MTDHTTRGDMRMRQIVDSAIPIFAARNYDAASVADIAASAGITKRAIYRYFPSKRSLFYAVRFKVYTTIVHNLWKEMPEAENFKDLAEELMRAHIRFCLDNPDMTRIVVNTISEAATKEFQQNIEAMLADRAVDIEALIRDGMVDGTVDTEMDATFLAWIIIMLFFFLIYLEASGEERLLSRGPDAASVIMRPFLKSLAPMQAKTRGDRP